MAQGLLSYAPRLIEKESFHHVFQVRIPLGQITGVQIEHSALQEVSLS